EPDELAALHLAASTVRLEGLDATSGLWKLGGVPADVTADEQPPGPITPIPADERVVALFSAVAERSTVTFTYRGQKREVDPYRLDFQRGHWYVSGFDHVREWSRVYRLDRFESDVGVGRANAFTRPEGDTPGGRLD